MIAGLGDVGENVWSISLHVMITPITIEATYVWHDDVMHAILKKITFACGIFTSDYE
jgi:hypothetical protein